MDYYVHHPRWAPSRYSEPSYQSVDPFYRARQQRELKERAEHVELLRAQAARRAHEDALEAKVLADYQARLRQQVLAREYLARQAAEEKRQRAWGRPIHFTAVPSSSSRPVPRPSPPKHLHQAAVTIQRAFRSHLEARQRAQEIEKRAQVVRKAVDNIRGQFESAKAGFKDPDHLEFDDTGSLTYSPVNAPLRAYEDGLVKLLTRLDEVESHGDVRVRAVRKSAVLDIENELSRLDSLKIQSREAQKVSVADDSNRMDLDAPVSIGQTDEVVQITIEGPEEDVHITDNDHKLNTVTPSVVEESSSTLTETPAITPSSENAPEHLESAHSPSPLPTSAAPPTSIEPDPREVKEDFNIDGDNFSDDAADFILVD